jgi:hypothetical protein
VVQPLARLAVQQVDSKCRLGTIQTTAAAISITASDCGLEVGSIDRII